MPIRTRFIWSCLGMAFLSLPSHAVEQATPSDDVEKPATGATTGMTPARMLEIARLVDDSAQSRQNTIEFVVEERSVLIIYDEVADRMRMMVPIAKIDELEDGQLMRMMQANFDSALDARYAVARDMVWSVFIHPLSSLSDAEFVDGIGETVNVAETFGQSYSSGMFVFRGGDSGEIERRRLIDRLRGLIDT